MHDFSKLAAHMKLSHMDQMVMSTAKFGKVAASYHFNERVRNCFQVFNYLHVGDCLPQRDELEASVQ